jgi:ABC-2 type transport system ATP-binding protein
MTQPTVAAPNAAAETGEPGGIVVRAHGLVKRYGKFTAVDGVSFEIAQGEIFGLLGPNGAGKTTTLEMLEGLRTPDAGEAQVVGLDVRRKRRAVQQRIGVQLQATTLFEELTVRETLRLFASFYPSARDPEALLREVALEEKAGVFPQDLSGGQRQRLALALALVNDPTLLFLDEPTTGLDPQSRRLLWETILRLRERGKTIVLTTHFMDEAQTLCDRIAILDSGRIIAQDTPAGLISLLGATATIECALEAPSEGHRAIEPTDLRALPGTIEVRQGGGRQLIYTESVERTLIALLQLAAAHGTALDHLTVHTPTLEDVFLKLTGKALRD